MGLKSIEIIKEVPLILNERPKYRDKMLMLATFGQLGMNLELVKINKIS